MSLRPDDVHSIVFWSKNYIPCLQYLDELNARGYRCYFHFTITGAPRVLEPHVPEWQKAAETFRRLAVTTSPRHVQWRFDPILLTDEFGPAAYLSRFREIIRELAGATERCYFSFAQLYGKVRRRLANMRIQVVDPERELRRNMVLEMAHSAGEHGITLYACCQDDLVGGKVQKARCIDGDLLADLFPDRPRVSKIRPTRTACGCAASRDIGMYNTCPHGCVYCYANQNRESARRRCKAHDPKETMLVSRGDCRKRKKTNPSIRYSRGIATGG